MSTEDSIVIFGAGGHAGVVVDAIRLQGKYTITAVVDPGKVDSSFQGTIVRENEIGLAPTNFVVALGNNQRRKELFTQLVGHGWTPAVVQHPSAIVAGSASISGGTVLFARAVINPGSKVGENCIINTAATVDHDCTVGSHSHVAPGCNLAGTVTLGEGCFLGIGSSIIPDITFGAWSILGAGSVAIRDVSAYTTVVGSPARPINSRQEDLSMKV